MVGFQLSKRKAFKETPKMLNCKAFSETEGVV